MADPYLPSVFSTGQTPEDIVQLSRLTKLENPDVGTLPTPPVLSDRHYVPTNLRAAFILVFACVLAIVHAFAYARLLVRHTRSALSTNGSSRRTCFLAGDILLLLSVLFFTVYSAAGIYGSIALQWGFRGEDWTLKSVESSHKIFYLSSLMAVASLTLIRLDLLLFCRRANERLFASANKFCCNVLCVLTVLYFFGAVLAKTLSCGPSHINAATDVWEFARVHCNGRLIALGAAGADVFLNSLVVTVVLITIKADRAQRELGDVQSVNLNRPSRMMGTLCVFACFGSMANIYFATSPSLNFTSLVHANLCTDGVAALFIIASTFQILRRPGISRRARHASFATQGNSIISYPISPGLMSPGCNSVAPLRPPRTRSVEMDGRSIRGLGSPITEKPRRHRGSGGSGEENFDFDMDALSFKDIEVASSIFIKNQR